jgi:hypothetical protein
MWRAALAIAGGAAILVAVDARWGGTLSVDAHLIAAGKGRDA